MLGMFLLSRWLAIILSTFRPPCFEELIVCRWQGARVPAQAFSRFFLQKKEPNLLILVGVIGRTIDSTQKKRNVVCSYETMKTLKG